MLRTIYEGYASIREGGKEPVVFIDEAHLFHPDVFSQLHLLSQPTLRAMQDAMEHGQRTIGVDNVRRASAKWWES